MRTKHGWTIEALQRLAAGYEGGLSVEQIAVDIGSTRSRVLHKARALGLVHRRWHKRPATPPTRAAVKRASGPIDDRNPHGPVAQALGDLGALAQETPVGFRLGRSPVSTFDIIAAANARRTIKGVPPIRLRRA